MGQRRKGHTSAAAAPLVQDGLLHLRRPVQQQRQVPRLDSQLLDSHHWHTKEILFPLCCEASKQGTTQDRSLKRLCKKRGAFCVGRPERRSTALASLSQAPTNAASSSLVCPHASASNEARSHINLRTVNSEATVESWTRRRTSPNPRMPKKRLSNRPRACFNVWHSLQPIGRPSNAASRASFNTALKISTLWAAGTLLQLEQLRKACKTGPCGTNPLLWCSEVFDTKLCRVAVSIHH